MSTVVTKVLAIQQTLLPFFFYRTIIYINVSVFDFYFGAESHITEL